ncbi:MAG: DUF2914 domain-containing protein [Oleiphilaceae bacterium]|nr:DUF2914 domain-containing protein [Oleiphilaceae bacterium]
MSSPVFSFPPLIQRLLPRLEPWLPLLAFASGVASFVLVDRQDGLARWIVLAVLVALPLLLAIAWWGRYWVPPAGLWLERSAITMQIYSADKLPGERLDVISHDDLHQKGLYAYGAIRAPLGLRETIYHVWLRNGEVVDRIALPIEGGREEGYRSWTHKLAFPEDARGAWKVQMLTETGQMIGVLRFEVD